MAERLSQYSMLPNFNPGLMQSQQQQGQSQQQQQQQQHQDPAHPSGMQNFPEQARMWQQIQHAQYRPGQGDMTQQQSNAQVSFSLSAIARLARSTHLSTPPSHSGLSFHACGPLFSHEPSLRFHAATSSPPCTSYHDVFDRRPKNMRFKLLVLQPDPCFLLFLRK